jgi:hypothetical protein
MRTNWLDFSAQSQSLKPAKAPAEHRGEERLRSLAHTIFNSNRQFFVSSESETDGQLYLSGIAHSLPQESVKIEQARRAQGVDVVRVVECIEHFDDRNERVSLAKLNRSL